MLKAFASFGFCKAHAAAFALPTYQSAWLKAHHPAAFLAGVLTHDPGMYPKRLILDDARQLGIAVLGLDVNASDGAYRVERVAPWDEPPPRASSAARRPREAPTVPGLPDGARYGIRLALADVKGISDAEVARIVAGRPYASLADFWHRARVSRPVVERLVVAGGVRRLYGIGAVAPVRRRGRVTRRDLLLQVAELDRWSRGRDRALQRRRARPAGALGAGTGRRGSPGGRRRGGVPTSCAAAVARHRGRDRAEPDVQLALDLGDAPDEIARTGLPEMTGAERVRAELDVLGLDASRHVVDFYAPMLEALGVTRAADLLRRRSRRELLVAGVKVATQTPPIRSGRRVVFLTLDDATGPVDATFFEDVQGPYAATVFHSWLLVVRACCAGPARAASRCGRPGRGSCRRCAPPGRPGAARRCRRRCGRRVDPAGGGDGGRRAAGRAPLDASGRGPPPADRCPGGHARAPAQVASPTTGCRIRGGAQGRRRPDVGHGAAGRRVLVHASGFRAVAVRRHQAAGRRRQANPRPRGSEGPRRATTERVAADDDPRAEPRRPRPPASSGTPAPAAPVVTGAVLGVARVPRRRTLHCVPELAWAVARSEGCAS